MIEFSEQVSVFRSCYETEPCGTILLKDWLQNQEHAKTIYMMRSCSMFPDIYQQIKRSLPAITPLGVFSRRRADGCKAYSGFVCIDVDGKDNSHIQDWDILKKQLGQQFPSLYYAGLSCGGRGIFLIFRVKTPKLYLGHLNRLFQALKECGVEADRKCTDMARLRFASYDAHPYENYEAVAYDRYLEPAVQSPEQMGLLLYLRDRDYYLELLVSEIERRRVDITEGYSTWFAIGCSIAKCYGESGRSYFHRISSFNSSYNPTDCDRQYDACLRHPYQYTIRTLFYHCKKHGVLLKYLINGKKTKE